MALESCSLAWSSPFYHKIKEDTCTDGNKILNKVLYDMSFDYPIGWSWSEVSAPTVLIPKLLMTFNNNGDKE